MKTLVLPLIIFAGCAVEGPQGDVLVEKLADLNPGASPGTAAALITGPTRNAVEVRRSEKDGNIVLDLVAHGEIFESEVYRIEGEKFQLVEAASDRFEPALPLLEFPLTTATRKYEGKLNAGVERPVKATIAAVTENLFIPTQTQAVKVTVVLSMESGAPTPATRTLTFWFAKDKGVVKREFGNGLTREPNLEKE